MSNSNLDECVNCGAGIIDVSAICPQCGWIKNKPIEPDTSKEKDEEDIEKDEEDIEKDEEDIEKDEGDIEKDEEDIEKDEEDIERDSSVQELSIIKNKIFRPTGVKFISMSYMLFGISLILFGIIFVSVVMFLVMSDAMGELGGIGDGMGNMPMLPGMGGMDASTKSSLGNIIDLNRIAGSPSASEIEMRMNSSGIMNIDVMMEIIGEAGVIALIEIIVGLMIFGIGLILFKGKKWARPLSIIFSIISIPFIIAFVTTDNQILLVLAAFNIIVIYYMLKQKARDYFNQT